MPPSSPAPGPSSRKLPNIVVTGTPGTGKTSHAQAFLEACPWRYTHLNVGEIVKEKGCHEGWNEEWQSYDVDDDRVRFHLLGRCLSRQEQGRLTWAVICMQLLDELESHVEQGGKLIDWHSCEIFPERWVDLVIVIRCDHSKLWERLEKR